MVNTAAVLGNLRLQQQIQQPNYDELWLQGYEEGIQAVDESENPFKAGTIEHHYWQEGWWAAFYGEEPLFNYQGDVNPHAIKKAVAANEEHLPAHDASPWGNRFGKVTDIILGTLLGSSLTILLYELLL